MRLIDADALEEQGWIMHRNVVINPQTMEWQTKKPAEFPTIDAVPVVHGEWVIDLRGNWACSICGNDPYHYNMENMNYCPNCGAKMDGERKDDE